MSNENCTGAKGVIWLAGIIVISIFSCTDGMAQTSSTQSKPTLTTILTDSNLWGKDFPLALASLNGWAEAGQRSVAIFRDRIVGGKPFKTREEAEQTSKKMSDLMETKQFNPKPEFEAMFKGIASKSAVPLKTEIISRFQDDDSVRVAYSRADAEFLAPNLTIAIVQERLGRPQKVEQEVIQSEGDRRPVILTLYRYADGAVSFAKSDIAAQPEMVDRVLLDVPAVVNAIQVR
jgi:hypothetical protein